MKDQLVLDMQQTKKADSGFNSLDAFVMLQSKVKELLECDVKNNIFDDYASDGDGRFDMWKTSRLIDIMSDLRKMVYLST